MTHAECRIVEKRFRASRMAEDRFRASPGIVEKCFRASRMAEDRLRASPGIVEKCFRASRIVENRFQRLASADPEAHPNRLAMALPTRARIPPAGFTLVELIVVVAVIVLLVSLIAPSIQKASARAVQAKCISNVRQMGMALRQYTLTNFYHLPYCTRLPSRPPAGEQGMPGIADTLSPFLDNPEVMRCPAEDGRFYVAEKTSYEWNSLLNGKPVGQEKLVIVGVSYEVPLLGDYEHFHAGAGEPGKNFLYTDGSVLSEIRMR